MDLGLARAWRRRALWLVVALSFSCATHGSDASGAGTSKSAARAAHAASPAVATALLAVLSDDPVRLGFGDRAVLRVQLTDLDGVPTADGQVSFALVGRAQDSSLESLDATTDQDGVAEKTLVAGKMSATFTVRVSASGAFDTSVDVAVSNAGFGTITASAPYTGMRKVKERLVFAQAGVGCAQAARMPGDPMVSLADKSDVARFLALPAGQSYAVTALAQSETGTLLAQGCTDSVMVSADTEVMASIALKDEPLQLAGTFDLQADLDTSGPATTLGNTLRGAAEATIRTDAQGQPAPIDAEGRFLLDSLDGTLRSDSYAGKSKIAALATNLSQARMLPSLDGPEHSLQALLDINDAGPLQAVARMTDLGVKSLGATHLLVNVALTTKSGKRPLVWMAQRIDALPSAPGASLPAIDLSALGETATTSATFVAAKDVISLSSVRFRAQLGALGAEAVAKVTASDKTGHADELRTLMGCDTLSEWLALQSYGQNGACDSTCVQAACDRAIARLVSAAQTALTAQDDARPTLTLRGELSLQDDDGDLVPDTLQADMLTGQWDPAPTAAQGDAVSGAANAAAVQIP